MAAPRRRVGSGVGLACARLAINDLTSAGHQPLSDPLGTVQIVCNGEIYNSKELERELTTLGHIFVSRSDSEVAVHGYRQWGVGVFARLRGMFAIALWDDKAQRLFLARDLVGKKPLYYGERDHTLVFGSEIKAVLACKAFARRANLEAIHHYLTLQYVPTPWTAFEGIESLPPAHYLEIGRHGLRRLVRYAAAPVRGETSPASRGELIETLTQIFIAAVRDRLRADVPVGAFLSGGVDSSSIVSVMAQYAPGRLKTFSVGFGAAGHDERRYARMVADRYATDHHELLLEPDLESLLPKLTWLYGQPFADSSAIPTFCVSQLASSEVKVALTGDGGDELFFGYDRYEEYAAEQSIDRLPRAVRRIAGRLADAMPPGFERHRIARIGRRLLTRLDTRNSRRYARRMAFFSDLAKCRGYAGSLAPFLARSSLDIWEQYFSANSDMVSGAADADFHCYLPDDLMVKTDVATMAHGLEARSPLLDERLIAWAAALPAREHLAGGVTKALLKQSMAKLVPAQILQREKMGFRAPLKAWIDGPLWTMLQDTLTSQAFRERELFEPACVAQLMSEHRKGVMDHHPRLWALLMMELWFRMWIDPARPPDALPTRQAGEMEAAGLR